MYLLMISIKTAGLRHPIAAVFLSRQPAYYGPRKFSAG